MYRQGLAFVCILLLSLGAEGGTGDAAPDTAVPVAEPALRSTEMMSRARTLVAEKNWEAAADLYRQILKVYPDDLKASFELGTAMLQLKRFKDAIDILVPLLAELPDDPSLKNNIAWIYATSADPALRNPTEAVRLAQQATLAMPNEPDVWNTLAESHYAAAEFDMALRTARIALQLAQEKVPSKAAAFMDTFRRCNRAVEAGKAPVSPKP